MSNLPIQFQDKINSPELLAFLQQFGEETYIDAELINKFRDAINELGLIAIPDRIISLGTETKVDNTYTYQDYVWSLNNIEYTNTTPDILTIAPATTGFKRKDISVFTNNGTIEIVQGIETDGATVTTPEVPAGTLYFKFYDVDGATVVDDPTIPIIGTQFIKKSDAQPFQFLGSGSDAIIPLSPLGGSEIRLQNPALVSIAGFDLSLITGVPTAEVPYTNKPYQIRNLTGNPVVVKNESTTADTGFFLTKGIDLTIPVNESLFVKYDVSGMVEAWKSWGSGGVPQYDTYFQFLTTRQTLTATGTWRTWIHAYSGASFWSTPENVDRGTGVDPAYNAADFSIASTIADNRFLDFLIWEDSFPNPYSKQIRVEKYDILLGGGTTRLNRRTVIDETISLIYAPARQKINSIDSFDTPTGYVSIYVLYIKDVAAPMGLHSTRTITWNFKKL